ncbi:MAG: glutathione-disulfide reductase [Myxococcota bacterium]
MPSYDYDLFTIGAGSGGVRASRVSASLGARVAIAEDRYLGGTCVNVGCIPKKLLVYAAHYADDFEDSRSYGWSRPPATFDWPTLIAAKDREIERLNAVYARLLDQAGVERVWGRARIVDAHTVVVEGREYRAEHILVATGSWPRLPGIEGVEHAITSNEVFGLPELPERIVIVGGGYIAVEFAGILHNLGTRVTQLYRGPLFLRGFDDEVREGLAHAMRRRGIDLRFESHLARIEHGPRGLRAILEEGDEPLETDQVLMAIGREPMTADLGLEALGVKRGAGGEISVDAFSRSSVPSIWAIGDVTDRITLTPMAIHEGIALAHTLFGSGPLEADHSNVPSAVFSHPPIATVGLTEAQARAGSREIEIYRSRFRPLRHTLTGRHEETRIKLVVDAESDRVLGAHMLGADAAEIVQGIAIALKCGATKAQFDATVGIHPTTAEEFVTLRDPVGN